jgi:DNA-binding transcriptional ArsR family regulator
MATEEDLSLTFAALADPTRRAMLARLARGPATVTELAAPFGLAQPTISKHLKVLERAKLISRSQKAQLRPAMLQTAPLVEVSQWLDGYRQFWEANFDQLDSYITSLQEAQK